MAPKIIFACMLWLWASCLGVRAQYAPQVGIPGCDAIADPCGCIMAWAPYCELHRGFLNIDTPSLGFTANGTALDATGIADRQVVSLGDSGVAILTFPGYIFDAPGPDFAVFENGFTDPANDTMAFLELAFVAVSSDGVHYTSFPVQSNVPADRQIRGSGDYMDARLINGLAGKYKAGYGTPFDLAQLAGTPGLDVTHITHIRITDAVGAVNSVHATHDSSGRVINDPFPTSFPTGGFDLDAVALIHYPWHTAVNDLQSVNGLFWGPNPAAEQLQISGWGSDDAFITVTDILGNVRIKAVAQHDGIAINVATLPAGQYFIALQTNQQLWRSNFLKL